jgi:hypothetical protein
MSLEDTIALAAQEVGKAREEVLKVAGLSTQQIAAVTQAYLTIIAQMKTNFFVDFAGGNDASPGTEASPLKTITRALALTPFGGSCTCTLKSDYTVSSLIFVDGRQLTVKSALQKYNLFFERLSTLGTNPLYRYPVCFYLDGDSSVAINNCIINVPELGNFAAYTPASSPSSLFSVNPDRRGDWVIRQCDVKIPAQPFCSLFQGSTELLGISWQSNVLNGAQTSLLGNLLSSQTNPAGVATSTLPWLQTNLTNV